MSETAADATVGLVDDAGLSEDQAELVQANAKTADASREKTADSVQQR